MRFEYIYSFIFTLPSFAMTNSEQNTFRELLQVFFNPFRQLSQLISKYFRTSMLILTAKGVPAHLLEPAENRMKDIRYAFATFEFLLIFLFLTKITGAAADLDELREAIQASGRRELQHFALSGREQ